MKVARQSSVSIRRRCLLSIHLVAVALLLCAGLAQAASYIYDANGRLRAVTSSSGASSAYVYDALGNLVSVNSVAANQLAIFAFTPNHGPVGTSVVIRGSGFGTSPGSNIVKFNGTQASISQQLSTSITAAVPAGASSGPVSVTVGTTTVTSTDIFTVTTDSGGAAPTITAFSPSVVNPGNTVTVTGSHFSATAGLTLAGVGVYASAITPTSDTQLAFSVATQAGPGYVVVMTPYGSAQSSQPLIVVPSTVMPANVVAVANIGVDGPSQPLNISTAGKYGAVTFQGTAGQWLTLQLSQFTTTGTYVTATLYEPSGVAVKWVDLNNNNGTTVSAASLSMHLSQLQETGTYLVLFTPQVPTATASFSIGVESNPPIGPTVSATVPMGAAGQGKRVVFEGIAGQFVGLNVLSLTGGSLLATITDPYGEYSSEYPYRVYTSTSASVPGIINVTVPLPRSTMYPVYIKPSGGTTSTTLGTVVNPLAGLSRTGLPQTVVATAPNENAYFTFTGTTGQNVSVGISNLATNPSATSVYYKVEKPDGSDYINSYCYVPRCHIPMPPQVVAGVGLPQDGTYLINIYPASAVTMTNVTAVLSNDISGILQPNTAFNVSTVRKGQVARLTFTGPVGQYNGLNINVNSTSPANGHVAITAYDPNGSTLAGGFHETTSQLFVDLSALTSTNSYSVQVEPSVQSSSNDTDTFAAAVTLVPNPTAPIAIGSPVNQAATQYPGEDAYMTFSNTGPGNQNLVLSFSNIQTTAQYVYVNVYGTLGGPYLVSQFGCPASTGCNIPMNGVVPDNYTVHVLPSTPVTMGYTATLSSQ